MSASTMSDVPGPILAVMEAGFGLWHMFWFELPIAWLSEVDHALAIVALSAAPMSPVHAVALGLGCRGDEDDRVLALDQGRSP